MLPDKIREFATQTHRGVLTTFRRDGNAQMSIISCGPYRDGIAFTVTETRAKLHNLRRNPNCSLLVSNESWWGFVVLEGQATILSAGNTDADELRLALQDTYRAASGEEHLQLGRVRSGDAGRPPVGDHRCAGAHLWDGGVGRGHLS